MSNVEALKNLAAVVCGVEVQQVKGTTAADVIRFIAENYPKSEVETNAGNTDETNAGNTGES